MYRFRVIAQSRVVLAAWVASSIELSRKRYVEDYRFVKPKVCFSDTSAFSVGSVCCLRRLREAGEA